MTTQLPLPTDALLSADLVTVGTYPTYSAAQQAVDYLSDHGFPVRHATVVGTDVRLVESVLGRMTVARAGLAGAGSGAWLGLLIGALLALFTTGGWLVLPAATAAGAVWGATFAAVAHAATRGRRDFVSRRQLAAGAYQLTVAAAQEQHARRLLMQHTWRT